MIKIKKLQKLNSDYVIVDYPSLLNHFRTQVTPAYTKDEIEKQKYGWYMLCKFADDNQLTTRKLVTQLDDLESLVVKVGDYTKEGFRLMRLGEDKYLSALDRGTAPEKAIKILERDLQKIRTGESFSGDWIEE